MPKMTAKYRTACALALHAKLGPKPAAEIAQLNQAMDTLTAKYIREKERSERAEAMLDIYHTEIEGQHCALINTIYQREDALAWAKAWKAAAKKLRRLTQ